jgi:ribosome-binding protein aMBF1 (putative translation factor)
MSQLNHHPYCCWICGNEVDLKTCNIDECGMAVHEDCYLVKVAFAAESMRLTARKPAHRVRRVVVSDIALRKGRPTTR